MKSTPRPVQAGKVAWGFVVWLVLFALAGAALCLTPLFNVLGFESSLVLALLASLAAVHRGSAVVARARLRLRATDRDLIDAAPLRRVISLVGQATVATWMLCALPLLMLIANGLRVRNCNYLSGLQFFALLPVCSAAMAATVGVVAGLLTTTRGRALGLGYGLVLGSLLWAGLRSLNSPAIFAYDPFFGYFPGALYDEEVRVQTALYASRAEQLLFALAAAVLAARFLCGKELRCTHRAVPGRGRLMWLGSGLLLLAVAVYWQGGRLGLYADESSLAERLPGQLDTAHFVLRYRPGGPVERDLRLYAREHELRYLQLRELLGVEPNWEPGWLSRLLGLPSSLSYRGHGQPSKVVSYLFDSVSEKRRAMGAGGTYIAKPWRKEIYIQHEAWPHPVLRHELAHVFAGAAGDRLFRLSMAGVIPQLGLVEGIAVAADRRVTGNVALHQSVRAMRQAGLLPPLEQVFSGLGFWALPSGRAYTVAGSFSRYLLTQHGAGKLLAVYHAGGRPQDFARIYGSPFAELREQWLQFIEAQPLPPQAREVERERYRRPAVFHKVCAHELAIRRERARELIGQGRESEAVALLESVCRDDPGEPGHLSELAEALAGSERLAEAEATLQRASEHPATTPALRARLLSRLGDLAALQGQLDQARQRYDQAAALPLDEATSRNLLARRQALDLPEAGPLLLKVLVGGQKATASLRREDRSDAVSVYLLDQATGKAPQTGLIHYILGRLLFQRGGYAESIPELRRSLELGLPDRRFVYQAELMIGQAELLLGQSAAAQATFEHLASWLLSDEADKQTEVTDFVERARHWDRLPTTG
jgi:tetratricopeptide (TPR) repeat protein